MQTASHQVAAAVDEMRKRMADLQTETEQAMGATKESMAPRQTEQETANQSVAGEEDPFAGLDQEGPQPQGSSKGAEIPRPAAMASLGPAEMPAGDAVRAAKS